MRESHRQWRRVCDLTERIDAEIDPIREYWLKQEVEKARVAWLNAVEQEKQDRPWRIAHGVLIALFGLLILAMFAAMCTDVIARLL